MLRWSKRTQGVFDRRNRRVAAQVRRGILPREVAAKHGISLDRVYRICNSQGLRLRDDKLGFRARMARLHDAIARAAAAGMTSADIADRFHRSRALVWALCKKRGIRLRRREQYLRASSLTERRRMRRSAPRLLANVRHPNALSAALLLLKTDLTMERIASRCGVTRQRVQQVWRQLRNGRFDRPPPEPAKSVPAPRAAPVPRPPSLALRPPKSTPKPAAPPARPAVRTRRGHFAYESRGLQARYVRVMPERTALAPRATELLATLPPGRSRLLGTLLLGSALNMEQIGDLCGVSKQTVHGVWVALRVAGSAPAR